MADAPARRFVTTIEDSRRWRHVERRPGDIVISTPPKSGTTWMQGIVTSLLWPHGDAPGTRQELSPWIDMRLTPIDELAERVSRQQHRRFFKTHSPADCIPVDERCRYIVVYRDGRDALVSWANHRQNMHPEIIDLFNAAATAEAMTPMSREWDGDIDELFDEWEQICSPVRHLAAWWPRRHQANVLFVHYADLSADLAGEMRRIADHLGIDVADNDWPEVVARCSLDSMRAAAEAQGSDLGFRGGAKSFFFQGRDGRWKEILTDAHVERYRALVAEGLSVEAADWLESGSLELGQRPNLIGEPPGPLQTGGFHPVFGRIQHRTTSGRGAQAIAERRVERAREDGLFDDLEGAGKPIADIDRHRPSGWWANNFVKKERSKVKAMQLEEEIRNAKPALWRLPTEVDVIERVGELNERIDQYNRVTTLQPMAALDITETVGQWRRLRA